MVASQSSVQGTVMPKDIPNASHVSSQDLMAELCTGQGQAQGRA